MKTALITGGNRGIGLEICRQLDKKGFRVVMGSRDPVKGWEAARGLGKQVVVAQLDVTDEQSIRNLFERTQTSFGVLDVLINNAGIGAGHSDSDNPVRNKVRQVLDRTFPWVAGKVRKAMPLLRNAGLASRPEGAAAVSMENVKQIMETNFYGPWRMIQVFLPLLKQGNDARIINISSGMGELTSLAGDYPGYRMSKASLNALTIMFAAELGQHGIRVNAMCPGWVRTDMGGPNAPRHVSEGADTAVWLATAPDIPTGRFFRDRQEISW